MTFDLPKKVRALALRHALSSKVNAGSLIVLDAAALDDAQDRRPCAPIFAKLGLNNALVIAGPEVEANFGLPPRNIPNVDVLPNAGLNVYDILRRHTLVLTKAAIEAHRRPLRARRPSDARHPPLRRHPLADHHREGDLALRAEQGGLPRRHGRHQAEESPPPSSSCSRSSVVKVNTLIQKGKAKRFRGHMGQRSDIKKAIVTLDDGQSIDITTGL